jgi:hypothetical protein
MAVSSGKLHVRLPQSQAAALFSENFIGDIVRTILGLGDACQLFSSPPPASAAAGWAVFTPQGGLAGHPWDAAHKQSQLMATAALGRTPIANVYVEPDLEHRRDGGVVTLQPAAQPVPGPPQPARMPVDAHFAPPASSKFSPGWHLAAGKFPAAWEVTKGDGVRIGHPDTGYWPPHVSTPMRIRPDLGANFYDQSAYGAQDTTDRGDHMMFGHGTATLALLAGNQVRLRAGDGEQTGGIYEGFLGGAPEAEIIPVKIGGVAGGVVHLFSEGLAQGLDYMLDPPDHRPCDVVSLSHGGLPTASWAAAVNRLYEAGIVLVAAAGDSYQGPLGAFPTQQTCYPAAFNRVITATGITFDSQPYKSASLGELQGCWGPDSVLRKSVAAPAPNVPWMLANTAAAWDNDGAGTSASTPQIAAACALWLAKYGARFHAGWQRVAACRRALLNSVVPSKNPDEIGAGQLNTAAMMASDLADLIVAGTAQLEYIPPDVVSFPLLHLLFSLPPQAAGEMCETEALQLVFTSPDPHFRDLVRSNFGATTLDSGTATYLRGGFLGHPDISTSLRAYLSKPHT